MLLSLRLNPQTRVWSSNVCGSKFILANHARDQTKDLDLTQVREYLDRDWECTACLQKTYAAC